MRAGPGGHPVRPAPPFMLHPVSTGGGGNIRTMPYHRLRNGAARGARGRAIARGHRVPGDTPEAGQAMEVVMDLEKTCCF